jgi:hypothetical protein
VEQSGFELLAPPSPFHRKIVRESGEIFGNGTKAAMLERFLAPKEKPQCRRNINRQKFASSRILHRSLMVRKRC